MKNYTLYLIAISILIIGGVIYKKGVFPETPELLVQMDNSGTWVNHCHIPEHMEARMMSKLKVI